MYGNRSSCSGSIVGKISYGGSVGIGSVSEVYRVKGEEPVCGRIFCEIGVVESLDVCCGEGTVIYADFVY